MALSTHLEVVLLAGNGLGFGAAKSARSILECLFIVEYLILNPTAAEHHRAGADYSFWKILEKAKHRGFAHSYFELDEDKLKQKNKVAKERFKSWPRFDKIAKEIGREAEYDSIYGLLSELVHSSHLGVSFRVKKLAGNAWPVMALGASEDWCDLSLYLSHKFLISIFEAVNRLFGLGYSEQLAVNLSKLERAWQQH